VKNVYGGQKMKVKDLLERLEGYEDYDLTISYSAGEYGSVEVETINRIEITIFDDDKDIIMEVE
jgi:hypothetical protein